MSIVDFINNLTACGVRFRVESGRLKVDAPKGTLTPELKAALIEHKDDILAMLKRQESSQEPSSEINLDDPSLTDDQREEPAPSFYPLLIEGSTPMPERTPLLMLPRSEVAARVLKEIARSLSVSISIGAGEQ